MGLDMYVWKAKKLSAEEGKKVDGARIAEVRENHTIFTDLKRGEDELRAIRPYCHQGKVIQSYLDLNKLADDHGITEPLHIGGACYSTEVTYDLYNEKGEHKLTVTMTPKEILDNYSYEKLDDVLVTNPLEEVYYWRKAYDVDEAIRNACAYTIENCGYYRLTNKMINAIRRIDHDAYESLIEAKENLEPDEMLFYHIWF